MTQAESTTIVSASDIRLAKKLDALRMTTLMPNELMRAALKEIAKVNGDPLREAIENLLYYSDR